MTSPEAGCFGAALRPAAADPETCARASRYRCGFSRFGALGDAVSERSMKTCCLISPGARGDTPAKEVSVISKRRSGGGSGTQRWMMSSNGINISQRHQYQSAADATSSFNKGHFVDLAQRRDPQPYSVQRRFAKKGHT